MSEIESATTDTIDRTVAGLKDGMTTATDTYRDASAKASRTATDAAAFQQGTMQAYSEAGQIWATGAQDLFRQWAAVSQDAMQESLANVRALMSARTPKEAIELHGTIVRTAAVRAVSESARLAQAGIELAEKASAPLTARAVQAAEKMTSRA